MSEREDEVARRRRELNIREQLSRKLGGVEFATDDELLAEQRKVEREERTRIVENSETGEKHVEQIPENAEIGFKDRRGAEVTPMTVTDLINACVAAAQKMSSGNDHRKLLLNSAWALRQLCEELWALEHPEEAAAARAARGETVQ